jgi:hypothetical protein
MAAFSTGNEAKLLREGLNVIWGTYKDHPFEYKDLFEVQSSEKQYEEDQLMPGLGLLSVKTEGSATAYQNTSQGLTTRTTHIAYSSGFMITYEAIRDNLYKKKGVNGARMLMKAARVTKETVSANGYNRAHNGSYLGADGVVWCSTAHPTTSGNQSNRLTTAADFSEASLEDLCVQIANAKDEVGLPAALADQEPARPDRAHVRGGPGPEVGRSERHREQRHQRPAFDGGVHRWRQDQPLLR